MKVTAKTIPTETTVDIEVCDLLDLLYNDNIKSYDLFTTLRQKVVYEWTKHKDAFIKNDIWTWNEECNGSHTFWIDRDIRPIKSHEAKIMEAIAEIEALFVENKIKE